MIDIRFGFARKPGEKYILAYRCVKFFAGYVQSQRFVQYVAC